jgi:predicted Zn-dependent peptidase
MVILEDYKIYTLDNNFKYLLINNECFNSVSTYIYVGVGSSYESKDTTGFSHFIEHLVFKGTKNIKNSYDLLIKLDSMGADYNAFTSYLMTVYHVKVSSQYQDKVLDIFSDMLFNSIFDMNEINLEKKVVFQEMNKSIDDPNTYIYDLIAKCMYKNHPLGNEILGTEKSLNSSSTKNLLDFYKKYYIPSNMCLIMVGNIKTTIHKDIQKFFGKNNKNQKTIEKLNLNNINESKNIVFKYRDYEQSIFSICFYINKLNKKELDTLEILETILGGNMTSRLFLVLREKEALVYNISCESLMYSESGLFVINGACSEKNLCMVIKKILEELINLKGNNITNKELTSAIYYTQNSLNLEMEDNASLAEYYGDYIFYNKPIVTVNEKYISFKNISSNNITKLSKKIFNFSCISIFQLGRYKPDKKWQEVLKLLK